MVFMFKQHTIPQTKKRFIATLPQISISKALEAKEKIMPILEAKFSREQINLFNCVLSDTENPNWSVMANLASRVMRHGNSVYSKNDKSLAKISGASYLSFGILFSHATYLAYSVSHPVYAAIYGIGASVCFFSAGVCASVVRSDGRKLEKALSDFGDALKKCANSA